jgi:hypothetical protein
MLVGESRVKTAIIHAVAYADVFDYPLTAEQVHRYLVGVDAPPSTVIALLTEGNLLEGRLECDRGYYFLPGREETVDTRLRRAPISAVAWPAARKYGRILARLPFIHMVAVSGALTMDNVEANTDIDFFMVTEPGRLWLSRALVVGIVQLAARRGHTLCPNYFLSDACLVLQRRNLFTAHELAQMVPVYGMATYRRMCRLNGWASRFLPNAFGPGANGESHGSESTHEPDDTLPRRWALPRRAAEAALQTPPGTWLENWERQRKVRKLTGQLALKNLAPTLGSNPGAAEVDFSPDRCKGHFDHHDQTTLKAFFERLRRMSVDLPPVLESLRESETHTDTGLGTAA